jgi:hypothetical protein
LDYVEENLESTFIHRERRIDNYEMNWNLSIATKLMGKSQLGGSMIGMFLDLTKEGSISK